MERKASFLVLRYSLAVGAVAAATVLTLLIWQWLNPLAFLVYFLAVMAAGWYGGLGPGLFATLLSVVAVDYFVLRPQFSWMLDAAYLTRAGFFMGTGTLISVLNESQRRARFAEQEEHERLGVTLASIGDGVITTDGEGRVTFLNPVAERLTGWENAAAQGHPIEEVFRIINEDTRCPVASPVTQVLERRTVVGMANHTVLLARDGRETPIDDSAAPIQGRDGAVRGVVLIFRDISERRQAELNRQRLAAIIEGSEDAIISQDLEGHITSWNPAAERLYGYRAEEVVGRPVAMLMPPGQADELPQNLERLQRGEGIAPYDTVRRRKDGRLIDVSVSIAPVRDRAGEVVGASKIARDITAAKQTERALGTVEAHLRMMVENVKDHALFSLDPRGRVVSWNPGAERLFGYAEPAIVGQPAALLFTPEDQRAGAPEQELQTAAATGMASDDRWHVRQDGSRFFASGTARPMRDGAGQLVGFTKVCRDITERKATEDALRAAHDSFRHLVENSPFGVYAVDADFRLVQVSAGARRVFENVRPLLGRDFAEVLRILWPEPFANEAIARFRHTLATGEPFHAPSTVERRHDIGVVESYDWKIERITLPDGRFGVVCHFYDLSERQQYEEALREADRRKDEFLAMLAHELRNPLAPVLNAVQIQEMLDPADPRLPKQREVIRRQVEQMKHLLDDLLDVSRITQGKIALRRERLELATVLGEAVEASRPLLDEKRHELSVLLPAETIWLEADRTRLAEVFTNLLNNAAKYTDPGGRIVLSAELQDREIRVSVRDTGIGMAPEVLANVFDLFTQGDRSLDRSQGGLGIGLTIVRRLVEMHGGEVHAHSAGPGMGSEFVVVLPVQAIERESGARRGEPSPRRASAARARRILVVDDNVDMADSLVQLLELDGHEVMQAHDGPAAVATAQAHRPDVILLDIGLPGKSGYEVARELRVMPALARSVLVAISGYGQEGDRQRSQEVGFQHHLVKPVDFTALQALLETLDEPPSDRARPAAPP